MWKPSQWKSVWELSDTPPAATRGSVSLYLDNPEPGRGGGQGKEGEEKLEPLTVLLTTPHTCLDEQFS